jgi:prephenate dehydrogenase
MSNPDERLLGIAAVRGAVSVPANTATAIIDATIRMLEALVAANGIETARIVSAIFTATADLDADFPAHAARRIGWQEVPLLCTREIAVPGSLPRIIRVLLTVSGVPWGTRLTPVYLDEAARLRPDLTSGASDRPAAPGDRAVRRVAIVGLGQIGGSIGLALGRSGSWRRIGFDLDPAIGEAARARGAVDEIASSLEAVCASAAIAVIATPVDTIPALIDAAARSLPRGAALIDTGSARAGITEALARAASRGIAAVGGHPIAGSEGHGLDAARADLFEGASFALDARGEVPEVVAALVRDLGARSVRAEPADHDHALARTSHLPWIVACALREIGAGAAERGLAGPGFRDMTRLAASDPRIAGSYCSANAREVMGAWDELRAAVEARVRGLSKGEASR